MGDVPRSVALYFIPVFLIGTAVGSTLPEFGNILAERLGLWAHRFNIVFLALGIAGVGLALYLGYRSSGQVAEILVVGVVVLLSNCRRDKDATTKSSSEAGDTIYFDFLA